MSFDNIKKQYSREPFYLVEQDLGYCSLTYGIGACQAGAHQIVTDVITVDDFGAGAVITGNSSGATGTITSVTGSAPTYTITYDKTNGIDFDDGETVIASGSSSGIATINGDSIVSESGDSKCLNTVDSCQDPPSYDEVTKTYRFCTDRSPLPSGLSDSLGAGDPSVIPCLASAPSISPTEISVKGGLSVRASVSCNFNDLAHSDIDIDKYVNERTIPAIERSSFWRKLRARNPNYQFRDLRVLFGFIENDIFDTANFTTRYYTNKSLRAGGGTAAISGVDPLQLAGNERAQAPEASTGQLASDITGTPAAFSVGSGQGAEYPSGAAKVRIDKEVISYSSRTGDVFTISARGENNTTSADHNTDATVQICLEYDGEQVHDIVQDLLINYSDIDASYIDDPAWQTEADTFLSGLLTGIITTPTDVKALLIELSEAMPHYLWWNERTQKIEFTALKKPPASATVLNQSDNIMDFSTDDRTDMLVNTVFVRFAQIDPTMRLDEPNNYEQTYVRVDTDSIAKYKEVKTKVINSRWIIRTNKAAALQAAALVGRRFSDPPRMIGFSLDLKDQDVWTGQNRMINHEDIVDANGINEDTLFQIISSKESSDKVVYKGLEFKYGPELPEDEGGGDPSVDLILISLDDQNINLRTIYDGLFPTPDASTQAKFVIEAGVVIGSTSSGTESLDTGSWPAGATVTLQLNTGSYVVGKGGAGGASGNGGAGGDAIHLSHDLELINNGIIGGGGGGGGAATDTAGPITAEAGGGGGAGDAVGVGGASFVLVGVPTLVFDGDDGTTENGGTKGVAEGGSATAIAGDGGDLGQAGQNGSGGGATYSGGSSGNAIDKNGNTLTETVTGDIRGSVIA